MSPRDSRDVAETAARTSTNRLRTLHEGLWRGQDVSVTRPRHVRGASLGLPERWRGQDVSVTRPRHVRGTSLGLLERWRGQVGDTAAAGANEAASEAGFYNAAYKVPRRFLDGS